MYRLAISVVAAGLLGTQAFAADFAEPVIIPEAPDWTGAYIGLNVGYGWGDFEGWVDVGNATENGLRGILGNDRLPIGDADGWLGGAQIGYNWQHNRLVFGVEADIQFTSIRNDWFEFEINDDDAEYTDVSYRAELDWLGTLRGRIGYAFDRFMIYGTGGLAVGHIDFHVRHTQIEEDDGLDITAVSGSNGSTQWGWTLGIGGEFMLAEHVTAKLEYLYVDLAGDDFYFDFDDSNRDAEGEVGFNAHIVRVGLNYKF